MQIYLHSEPLIGCATYCNAHPRGRSPTFKMTAFEIDHCGAPSAPAPTSLCPVGKRAQLCDQEPSALFVAVACRCPIDSHDFCPIEMSLLGGGRPRCNTAWWPESWAGTAGSRAAAGAGRVRAAQPLRAVVPCPARWQCRPISRIAIRLSPWRGWHDARPFDGSSRASRLFGGRCRATWPRWWLAAYSACRAFTIASTADNRLLSTITPGWTGLDLVATAGTPARVPLNCTANRHIRVVHHVDLFAQPDRAREARRLQDQQHPVVVQG